MIMQLENPKVKSAINRIIYSQNNSKNGVTLICFASMHGNEPAGMFGMQKVMDSLKGKQSQLNGNFYALLGNRSAFLNHVRFYEEDLNRLWTPDNLKAINNGQLKENEYKEQQELYNAIKKITSYHTGDFVFIDLHTTSSPTIPFITISDSLNNRKLSRIFNIPIVLGIEEFLDGPLLSYINEFGHPSIGFEAGQHDDEKSTWHCEAFVWLIMENLGLVDKSEFPYAEFKRLLNIEKGFYEIIYRYALEDASDFEMNSGFQNFTPITTQQLLAHHNFNAVKSPFNGLIFMPLYQKQGEDGFFIVRKVSTAWLVLSSVLRSLKFHQLLRLLPGIHKHPENDYALIANKRIARFLTTKIFHLFGYRKKIIIDDKVHYIKRDRKVSNFV